MIRNQELAETVIREARKTVDYNTVQYSIDFLIDKINQQDAIDNLQWDEVKQSYFIESLMLGLPVLNIVFQEKNNNEWGGLTSIGQLIDGKQRLFTSFNFVNGNLRLSNLKVLDSLNGFTFKDLPISRQKKFQRISARAIAVNPKSDLSVFTRY